MYQKRNAGLKWALRILIILTLWACEKDELPGQMIGVPEEISSEAAPSEIQTLTAPKPPRIKTFVSETIECEVLIVGGSTAALAAALTSARLKSKTCWLEPTHWPGGQLSANGNPAIDLASSKKAPYPLEALAKHPKNQPKELFRWLNNPALKGAKCWVSNQCYEPLKMLKGFILPAVRKEVKTGYLKVFYQSVPTQIKREKSLIRGIEAVQRQATELNDPRFLSQAIIDWYQPQASKYFKKRKLTFIPPADQQFTVIDGSETGEVMALSQAPYLLGQEVTEGISESNPHCGQSFVFPFVLKHSLKPKTAQAASKKISRRTFYDLKAYERTFKWWEVFTYRRIKGKKMTPPFREGELSLQNWNPGNDYPYISPFLKPSEIQIKHWVGGFNLKALAGAEKHALGWADWFIKKAHQKGKVNLALYPLAFGTVHGLSPYPYLRESRRSIGLDRFIWKVNTLALAPDKWTAKKPGDHLGIGVYPIDIHPQKCDYSLISLKEYPVAPYYFPYRAFTHQDLENLVVTGKTMAQSFLVSASQRTQMTEWTTGVASGGIASALAKGQLTTQEGLSHLPAIRKSIQTYIPLDWHIPKGFKKTAKVKKIIKTTKKKESASS